jgi:1,4-dihydroxy-2-naphthoate octaprenyltransferase
LSKISYAQTPIGKAALANIVAGVLIHTMPENEKVAVAAECMIQSASLQLASSFNIEEMINDLLDGVPGLDPEKPKTTTTVTTQEA